MKTGLPCCQAMTLSSLLKRESCPHAIGMAKQKAGHLGVSHQYVDTHAASRYNSSCVSLVSGQRGAIVVIYGCSSLMANTSGPDPP